MTELRDLFIVHIILLQFFDGHEDYEVRMFHVPELSCRARNFVVRWDFCLARCSRFNLPLTSIVVLGI